MDVNTRLTTSTGTDRDITTNTTTTHCHATACLVEVSTDSNAVDAEVRADFTSKTDKAVKDTKRCYFLEIPPELRLQIYEHVFGSKRHVVRCYRDDGEVQLQRVPPSVRENISLLRSCHSIRREVIPVLRGSMIVYVERVLGYIRPFFHMPMEHLVKNIKSVRFCVKYGETVREVLGDIEAWAEQLERHNKGVVVEIGDFIAGEEDEEIEYARGGDAEENMDYGEDNHTYDCALTAHQYKVKMALRVNERKAGVADDTVTAAVWSSILQALEKPRWVEDMDAEDDAFMKLYDPFYESTDRPSLLEDDGMSMGDSSSLRAEDYYDEDYHDDFYL